MGVRRGSRRHESKVKNQLGRQAPVIDRRLRFLDWWVGHRDDPVAGREEISGSLENLLMAFASSLGTRGIPTLCGNSLRADLDFFVGAGICHKARRPVGNLYTLKADPQWPVLFLYSFQAQRSDS